MDNPAFYQLGSIRQLHLEPTARCQAACPMCARNLNGGATRGCIPMQDITLDDFAAWMPDSFLAHLPELLMCGNVGEPIMARDCARIFAHCRALNPKMRLGMNSNGSARTPDFWRELARLDVRVNFGIDGASAQTHARYRIHTDFDQILRNAATFIEAGGRANWDFLVFAHNAHEVDSAREMSLQMGFRKFDVIVTNRFGTGPLQVQDRKGKVIDTLEPSPQHSAPPSPDPETQPAPGRDLSGCGIACKVAAERSIFVSAGGLVFPCCWLGQQVFDRPGAPDSRYDQPWRTEQLRSFFAAFDSIGERNLDLHHTDLATIVAQHLPRFAQYWVPGPDRLMVCARVCGTAGPGGVPRRLPGGETRQIAETGARAVAQADRAPV